MHDDFPTRCAPLPKGTPTLDAETARRWAADVPGWELEGATLSLTRKLGDFRAALAWIARVGEVAEEHDHHPDIHLTGYDRVRLVLSTHSIGGLSANDFVVARAIDRLGD